VDRSGGRVIIAAAAKPGDLQAATVYVLGNDGLQRVPYDGDCWRADWWPPGPGRLAGRPTRWQPP
jgi:hypothetical protein